MHQASQPFRSIQGGPLNDPVAKEQCDRRLLKRIGDFLLEHRLDPSPVNYLLAHQLITKANPAAVAAVADITNGGIRLSQKDADRIVSENGIRIASEPVSAALAQVVRRANSHLDQLGSIVGNSQAEAARYGRDLQSSVAELSGLGIEDSIQELLRITSTMMERSKAAERQLRETAEEVETLRGELASAAEEVRTDALTGLPNRRALEDHLAQLQQQGVPFSIAIADVDNSKLINDRHGHAVGDRVLRAVARVLETGCAGHLVSRFGGEEFVILLASLRVPAAVVLVEGARCELAARRFSIRETREQIGTVTFSAGISEGRPGDSWLELLERADTLLYRAKEEGRNRIIAESRSAELDAG